MNGVRTRVEPPRPSGRRAALWIGLLVAAQVADLLTTAIDLRRGGHEVQPITSEMLGRGGVPLLFLVKLSLVIALAIAMVITLRWARAGDARGPARLYRVLLLLIQISVVSLTAISINNTALLPTL